MNNIKICWNEKGKIELEKAIKENNAFSLTIIVNKELASSAVKPFEILKYLSDKGIKQLDFEKDCVEEDSTELDKWVLRAYNDNEATVRLSIKSFNDIQQKVNNKESLESILEGHPIAESVARLIYTDSDNSASSLEDLIINRLESSDELLPSSHLETGDISQPGDISSLIYKMHTEEVEMNMDDAYNVSNLLFLNDPSELQATLNKNNKLLYLPHLYKDLLSDNPDRKFKIKLKVIEEQPKESLIIPFNFPKSINYRVFDSIRYGNMNLAGNDIFYLCINLPAEYYLTHYQEFEHLLYDTDINKFESKGKSQECIQFLIDSIAREGFKKPLIFKINKNGQLRGIANKCRIMIARYLNLPTIPAIVVSYPDEGYVNSMSGDYRALAEKYLSPYLLLPEMGGR